MKIYVCCHVGPCNFGDKFDEYLDFYHLEISGV